MDDDGILRFGCAFSGSRFLFWGVYYRFIAILVINEETYRMVFSRLSETLISKTPEKRECVCHVTHCP